MYAVDFDKTTFVGWYLGVNTMTGGAISYVTMFIIFIFPIFYYLKTQENIGKGIYIGGLTSSTFGLMFALIGAITWNIAAIPLTITIFTFLAMNFIGGR